MVIRQRKRNAVGRAGMVPVIPTNEIFSVSVSLDGAAAATAANYGKIFTAAYPCKVLKFTEVHTTAGNNAGAVSLDLERCQGTEVSGAGDLLTSAPINLKGTAETLQTATLDSTTLVSGVSILELAAGNQLNLIDTGTLTTLAGVTVTVLLKWLKT